MKYGKIIVVVMVLVVGIVCMVKWRSDSVKSCANSACFGDWYADMHATNAIFRSAASAMEVLNPPVSYYPTEIESNALAQAFKEIAEAYTNGSLSALIERMSAVPTVITNVAQSVFVEVLRPLCTSFGECFSVVRQVRVKGKVVSLKSNVRDFTDVKEFDDFAKRNIEVTRFLGEIEIKRGAASGYLVYLDKQVLKSLNKYREKFRNEGKSDLVARADDFIRQWHEQIESEKGYTRSHVRFQVKLQMSGGRSRASAVAFARHFVAGIVAVGYTPKWLDEEFPLPPKDGEE